MFARKSFVNWMRCDAEDTVRILVIGGGISGHLVKLRVPASTVLDSRPEPTPMTRQYGGNYLWERLDGIDCRAFTVYTTVDGQPPDEQKVRAYKTKIGKGMDANWREQFRPEVTGYEIARWPRSLDIEYGMQVKYIDRAEQAVYTQVEGDIHRMPYDALISTIPLPALMSMTFMPRLDLKFMPIHVHTSTIPPDAVRKNGSWMVNYISDPDIPAYRTTDRDGTRHYESLVATGIPTKKIVPGKIWPHREVLGILTGLASDHIYCFGRFARWSPEELVHETDMAIQTWARQMGVGA
jgi:hypothetical protein